MDRTDQGERKQLLRMGAPATLLFMAGLCAPAAWYSGWLVDRHGPAASLAGLPAWELLAGAALLALPFVALRLLRIEWQPER
jgi:hypothetical protein